MLPPEDIHGLFINWASTSPFVNLKCERTKSCWMTLPKITLWKIWLERNSRIFRGAEMTMSKIKALLGDYLSHLWGGEYPTDILESEWLVSLSPKTPLINL